MKTSVLLRLVLLIILLVIVIWGSVQIRKGGMSGLFASLGADIGNPNYINICPKRIHAVTWPASGQRIDEVKTSSGIDTEWRAHDPSERPLNYLSMEKWLSEHCLTQGEAPSAAAEPAAFVTELEFEYTHDLRKSLESAPSDPTLFRWDGRVVRSALLRQAIADLRGLAGWPAVASVGLGTSAITPSAAPHIESQSPSSAPAAAN